MSVDSVVDQICDALGRYYKSLSKPYDKLFSSYCEENGLDDDTLEEELEQNAEDCLLCDFDEDGFPFKKEPKDKAEKAQAIFDIIRKCKENPDVGFGGNLPTFDQDLFEIKSGDLEEIKKIYQNQCPVLWNSGMGTDGNFLQILAVAKKNNFDYLLHLVDDYSRDRVKHIEDSTGWTERQWSNNHRHFKRLKNVKVEIPKQEQGKETTKLVKIPYNELAVGAVISFGKRCTPKLLFSNMMSIHDSIETTVQYLNGAIQFIENLLLTASSVCPFQFDMCIASGKPAMIESNVGPDDDDDDDDDDETVNDTEQKTDFVDCVGDIGNKLTKNGLKFKDKEVDLRKEARLFRSIYDDFIKENDLEGKDDETDYIHAKRLITFVDRRVKNDDDTSNVYMYEPPKNCQLIPSDAVAEWYISSSRTCLLPNEDYGDGKDAVSGDTAGGDDDTTEEEQKVDNVTKLQKSNIGASFHAKGGLLTFSFHVKQKDVVKCYLYWSGQIIRFMAEDIKTVLPKIFNMDYGQNKEYIQDKDGELDSVIGEMQKVLFDQQFKAFQESYV